jgi:lipopolysaccharide transport system ATP-binding protein
VNPPAILAEGLGKWFSMHVRPSLRVLHPLARPAPAEGDWVLREIGFSAAPGESLGVLGRNGAGKSTLLRILAGAMSPSAGTFTLQGKAASVLELGLGFNVEMNGRDNAITNSLLLGIPPSAIRSRLNAIQAFSELGDAFDRPLHGYSSGMVARLAFAIAMHADARILLLDEALAVGDLVFQHKCAARLGALRGRVTMVLASHNTEMLVALCDRVLWLDHGRMREIGEPREVVEHYRAASYAEIDAAPPEPSASLPAPAAATTRPAAAQALPRPPPLPPDLESFGNGHARIAGAGLYDDHNQPVRHLSGGEWVRLVLEVNVRRGAPQPLAGFVVKGDHHVQLFGMNNETAGVNLRATRDGATVRYALRFRWPPLARGAYSISPAVGEGRTSAHQMCHWVHDALIVSCEPARTQCVGWLLGLPDATVAEESDHGPE